MAHLRMLSLYVNGESDQRTRSGKKYINVRVDEGFKAWTDGQEKIIIETGKIVDNGVECISGILSSDISNTILIKNNIGKLEQMNPEQRNDWFKKAYNGVPRIVKIPINKIGNRLAGESTRPIVVFGSAELKWNR